MINLASVGSIVSDFMGSPYFVEVQYDANAKGWKAFTQSVRSLTSTLRTLGGLLGEQSSGGERVLVLDSVEYVNFRSTSTVTSYPVETGINVTDYKYMQPDVIEMKGYIKRSSLTGSLVQDGVSAIASKMFDVEVRGGIDKLRDNLKYYKSNMSKLNISTKTQIYKNFTLEAFEIPENFDNYGLLEVTMTFKQIVDPVGVKATLPSFASTLSAGITRVIGLG